MVEGYDYFSIGSYEVLLDNILLVYIVDIVSCCMYMLKVKNLEMGELLSDEIINIIGQVYWVKDNKILYYINCDL